MIGENKKNPVLLFIHGGAGMPEYFLTEKYPTGLEKYFTVVWWDQRGAGLSFDSKIDPATMNHEQFVEDIIAVTNYLRDELHQEKIYLMGHSWGTSIAIQAVAKAPELYEAYLAVSQITDQPESEKRAYEYMLDYFNQQGDYVWVKRLEQAGYPSKDYDKIRDSAMHKAGIGTMRTMDSIITGVFFPSLLFDGYTFIEKINLWRGKIFSGKYMKAINVSEEITHLEVPIYFFCGAYDYTVNYQMVHDYYEKIQAPLKEYYLFENSAHSPIFEEPEKVITIIREEILPKK